MKGEVVELHAALFNWEAVSSARASYPVAPVTAGHMKRYRRRLPGIATVQVTSGAARLGSTDVGTVPPITNPSDSEASREPLDGRVPPIIRLKDSDASSWPLAGRVPPTIRLSDSEASSPPLAGTRSADDQTREDSEASNPPLAWHRSADDQPEGFCGREQSRTDRGLPADDQTERFNSFHCTAAWQLATDDQPEGFCGRQIQDCRLRGINACPTERERQWSVGWWTAW